MSYPLSDPSAMVAYKSTRSTVQRRVTNEASKGIIPLAQTLDDSILVAYLLNPSQQCRVKPRASRWFFQTLPFIGFTQQFYLGETSHKHPLMPLIHGQEAFPRQQFS